MFHAWFLFGNDLLRVSGFSHMYMWCVEISERSGRHIKTCPSCHHSLYRRSATCIRPLLKPSSFVFVVQIGKKSSASHLFLRPDINNISPLRAEGEKKLIEEGGGRKGRCCGYRTAIKRMKAWEILVYTYKI